MAPPWRCLIWPQKTGGKLKEESIHRIDIDIVMSWSERNRTSATVTGLFCSQSGLQPKVRWQVGKKTFEEPAKKVLLAAGVWTQHFLEAVPALAAAVGKIQAKEGVSFRVQGKIGQPFMKPWAPYKQIVCHQQRKDELWIGDGTAILDKNWNGATTVACRDRCMEALMFGGFPKATLMGLRPYCPHPKGQPCLFQRQGNVFVATGAGKSGTIAAGWVTRKLL
jgi:glycine/D-amino acid oxidase-like deaminating enzyme